jgi:hypothetical protein
MVNFQIPYNVCPTILALLSLNIGTPRTTGSLQLGLDSQEISSQLMRKAQDFLWKIHGSCHFQAIQATSRAGCENPFVDEAITHRIIANLQVPCGKMGEFMEARDVPESV